MSMNRTKVNFGCGPIQPYGWVNVDHDPQYSSFLSLDFFSDEQVDFMACHHVLSQTGHHELPALLKEMRRVMKFGGCIRISVPDILAGYTAFVESNHGWFPNKDNHDLDGSFCTWLTWYGEQKSVFTYQYLRKLLLNAGFRHVERCEFKRGSFEMVFNELDTREYESIFVEAIR